MVMGTIFLPKALDCGPNNTWASCKQARQPRVFSCCFVRPFFASLGFIFNFSIMCTAFEEMQTICIAHGPGPGCCPAAESGKGPMSWERLRGWEERYEMGWFGRAVLVAHSIPMARVALLQSHARKCPQQLPLGHLPLSPLPAMGKTWLETKG